jgi:hypothetical protein
VSAKAFGAFADRPLPVRGSPCRLHDLRHGTAMNALHGSASLHIVQHLLGRSSHAFAADVYGTVADALARAEARSTAETILARCGKPHRPTCLRTGSRCVDDGFIASRLVREHYFQLHQFVLSRLLVAPSSVAMVRTSSGQSAVS